MLRGAHWDGPIPITCQCGKHMPSTCCVLGAVRNAGMTLTWPQNSRNLSWRGEEKGGGQDESRVG